MMLADPCRVHPQLLGIQRLVDNVRDQLVGRARVVGGRVRLLPARICVERSTRSCEDPAPMTDAEAPASVREVLNKGLAKDPARRYQSSAEMLLALEAVRP